MNNVIFILLITLILAAFIIVLLKFLSSKKKLSSLSVEKDNYETVFQQANDAVLVIDIVDGKIHNANPSLAAMLGYTVEQLEHLTLFDIHPKNMLERSSEVIADVWEKGGMVYQDIPFVKANGEPLSVECSAKVMRYAGRPSVLIYARDITERLRMEGEIRAKNELIEEKNKNITDSIRYAKRFQDSFLPSKEFMDENLQNYFVLFKPKDIVSGDFYWVNKHADKIFFSVIDCTGHGVPGAFVSIVAFVHIQRSLVVHNKTIPGEMLDKLNDGVLEFFRQQGSSNIKDGMDIALCALDRSKMKLEFSGANNSAYLIRNGEIKELKADKQPIGEYLTRKDFTNNEIALVKGDTIYSFSDGYPDQFGGPKGKKFKYSQLENLLLSIQNKTMAEQKEILNDTIEKWKGSLEQVDDICVFGVRV